MKKVIGMMIAAAMLGCSQEPVESKAAGSAADSIAGSSVNASAGAVEMSKSVPKGWIEDFAAAKQQAAKEKKRIVLAFSGSDWCPWCVKMERDVYSKSEFIDAASRSFVLVMIDCPSDKSILSPLAAAQNQRLAEEYGISGFPSTLVVDADGREVKRFSGYRPTPQAALDELR